MRWRRRRKPSASFSILAVFCLTLGIGANAAVISVIDVLCFRPLPGAGEPGQVVGIYARARDKPDSYRSFSYAEYEAVRRQQDVFADVTGHLAEVAEAHLARSPVAAEVRVETVRQARPEGLLNALLDALPLVRPPLLVIHGDSYLAGSLAGAWVLARVAPSAAVNEQGERVLFRTDSQYHRISVTESAGVRYLRFDRSNQTALDMSDGYTSRNRYPNYMDLALALKPDAKRVLVLGLGGGAIPKRWWHDYPDMRIDVVEIDPAVIDVASRYFGLPDDPRLRVVNQDARRFVQTSRDAYDVVIVDCYYSDSVPFHLTTEEFFREVKARMTPGGVLAYNVIGSVGGEQSKLFRSTYRTAEGVFSRLAVFPIGISADGDRELLRNVIVLATDANITDTEIAGRARGRVDGRVKVDGFPGFADDLYRRPIDTSDVPVLTDSHAPVDQLIKVM